MDLNGIKENTGDTLRSVAPISKFQPLNLLRLDMPDVGIDIGDIHRQMVMLQIDLNPPMSYFPTVSHVCKFANAPTDCTAEIRDDIKSENLSFTNTAKRVGELWQALTPEEKKPYESQAGSAKEEYLANLAYYKTTDKFREYSAYLADFKAKHPPNSGTYETIFFPRLENPTLSTKRPLDFPLIC